MPQAKPGHFVGGPPSTSTSEARETGHPYAANRPLRRVAAQAASDASLVQVNTSADPQPEHPTNDEDHESGANKKNKKKNAKKTDTSGQPKSTRQQNTACRACRFRRCVQQLAISRIFCLYHDGIAPEHVLWRPCLPMIRWPAEGLSHAAR